MADLVADTDKINHAGSLLKKMADEYRASFEVFPKDDDLAGAAACESGFLSTWRDMRYELITLITRTAENLEEHGIALQIVAGNHEAADEAAAAGFEAAGIGGSSEESESDRQQQFDESVTQQDEEWEARNEPYAHG